MNKFLQLANKFEKVLNRLPSALQKPIQKEWRPLKELFLQKRAPRILIVGPNAQAFTRDVLKFAVTEDDDNPWHTFRNEGLIQFMTAEHGTGAAKAAITHAAPDVFLFLGGAEAMESLRQLHQYDRERYKSSAPIIGVGEEIAPLSELLHSEPSFAGDLEGFVSSNNREAVLNAITKILPDEARLEFARASGEKMVQREIANTLIRSTAAICGAIGAQPIPLADFPILTSLQLLLVSGIIHISGRRWSTKLARDFLAALGANIGIGLVFRESARAAVKLLPGWGNAISGAVAAGGTYAVGRAASAYFVEGLSMEQARQKFRSEKKKALPPPADKAE